MLSALDRCANLPLVNTNYFTDLSVVELVKQDRVMENAFLASHVAKFGCRQCPLRYWSFATRNIINI